MAESVHDLILEGLDRSMVGVEIGPFYHPVAPKRDGWNVLTVDFENTDYLIDLAKNHSQDYIRSRAHCIEPVDIVWSGENLDQVCLARRPEGFDFIVLSHVLEHFPNPISFFGQAQKLLKSNGVLSFAFPDMRVCFDLYKNPTFTPALVQAFHEERKIHSPENLLGAHLYAVHNDGKGSWTRNDLRKIKLCEPIHHPIAKYDAYRQSILKNTQKYIDLHAWVATPASFQLVMVELNVLGFSNFYVDTIIETLGADFLVKLRVCKNYYENHDIESLRVELLEKHRTELLLTMQDSIRS